MIFFIFLLIHAFFLTLKFHIILIKKSQYMIFLYKFYINLLSFHQQKFNHTSFETVLSLLEMKMNL